MQLVSVLSPFAASALTYLGMNHLQKRTEKHQREERNAAEQLRRARTRDQFQAKTLISAQTIAAHDRADRKRHVYLQGRTQSGT